MSADADLRGELAPLTREALRWVVRITSGEATRADALALADWRAQGPAHEAAFREAAAFRRAVRAMDLPPLEAYAGRASADRRVGLSRRALIGGGGAIAASLAALMAVRPPLGLWPSLAELQADHRTLVGQPQTFAPTAGVLVDLNARSALSLTDGGQGFRLIDGEAFVGVRPARRGLFTVSAGAVRLSTRDGSLNVSTNATETCVTCLSGTLERGSGDPGGALRPGDQWVVDASGQSRLDRVDPRLAVSWRQGVLLFQNTPLVRAVDAINRYRSGKILIASDALARRPINGLFHTDQIADALDQIQQLLRVTVTRLPGEVVLLA